MPNPHLQEGSAADRDAAAFSLSAEELRVFGVSCLGGALDASTTLLQAGGLTLRRGLSAGPAAPVGAGGSRDRSGGGSGGSGGGGSRRGGSGGRGASAAAKEAAHASVLLCCAANAGLDIVHVQRCAHSCMSAKATSLQRGLPGIPHPVLFQGRTSEEGCISSYCVAAVVGLQHWRRLQLWRQPRPLCCEVSHLPPTLRHSLQQPADPRSPRAAAAVAATAGGLPHSSGQCS